MTGITEFSRTTGFPDTKIFVNPDLKVYNLFGLTHAESFSQIKGNKGGSKDNVTGILSGFIWTFYERIKQGE